jgi:hypothetical protein
MCDPQDEGQEPVIAHLDVRDAKYVSWITSTTAEHHSPHEATQREIELLRLPSRRQGPKVCPFLNAASEFSDPSHPVRLRVAKHQSDVVQSFRSLAQQAGIVAARRSAEHVALLTDGAYEAARVSGPTGPAAQYERLAPGMLA